ncbi:hypothetical protein JZO81_13735 [Enterococcus hulanensis]|uniref:hypothetical protein n=1 Tax=Enterococcus TaxID=1350 RepID=UPI000B5A5F61|nr:MULTISPECIES: hypothetical protein [Enterococcus]MBO0412131.1 hypothetical protein [Enterococcus hulanensis]OTO19705.1 hypothetical protein A5875_001039 [Enterococcus sp. 3H8_DIV0648]
MKTMDDLKEIQLTKQEKTYSYLNSHHYNWFKAIDLNLLNSDGFTNYFLWIKQNEPAVFETLQERVLSATIISFQNELSDTDSFVLVTAAWANGFVPEKSAAAMQDFDRYLTNYTMQKDPLIGINQMNADFNQVLMQHLPKVRRQDLRLIARLLLLKEASADATSEELNTLNAPNRKRTQEMLELFQNL